MIKEVKKLWQERGFEILVGICIAFLLIAGLCNLISKKKGSWNRDEKFLRPVYNKLVSNKVYSDIPWSIPRNKRPREDSKGELECRRVLQTLFKKPFKKCRPDFLRNPVTGGENNLEIDCFDQITLASGRQLWIGVEYNGIQHAKYVPYFHKNKDAFYNQKYRDELKRRMCKDNGVLLIEVPHSIKTEEIERYLMNELARKGILSR